jgi:hypothetical protein
MEAVAETRKDLVPARGFLVAVLLIFGSMSFYCTLQNIIHNYEPLLDKSNLLSLALPPILTIAFLPFTYFYALYLQYDSLFVRISLFEKDKRKINKTKGALLRRFHVNLPALSAWAKSGRLWRISEGSDIHELLD